MTPPIDRKFKQSILIQIEDIETDLIIFNRISGLIKAIIRRESNEAYPFDTEIYKNGPINTEQLINLMIEKDRMSYPNMRLELDVRETKLDEFIKCIEVVAYHPKSGQKISQKVLLPLHPGLGVDIDSLNCEQLDEGNHVTE